MGTVEPERGDEDYKEGELSLVQVFEKDEIEDKMEPARKTLESSPAGTGVEAPGQSRFSCREMQ